MIYILACNLLEPDVEAQQVIYGMVKKEVLDLLQMLDILIYYAGLAQDNRTSAIFHVGLVVTILWP